MDDMQQVGDEGGTVRMVIYVVASMIIGLLVYYVFTINAKANEGEQQPQSSARKAKKRKNQTPDTPPKEKDLPVEDINKFRYAHWWMVCSMKAGNGKILDISLSPSDKLLASSADDNTVHIWVCKSFTDRDKRSIRVNIPFDNASIVRWSPDNTAFIIPRLLERMLEVYKIGRTPENAYGKITSALQMPFKNKDKCTEIVGLGIACNGKFVMSCNKTGDIIIWDVKGTVLSQFTACMAKEVVKAMISPCGRYVILGGAYNLEIWEVRTEVLEEDEKKSVKVKETKMKWNILSANGMIGPMCDFDVSSDSSKVVVLTQDGDWRLLDTTGNRIAAECDGQVDTDLDLYEKPIVRITCDGRIVAVGASRSLYLFSGFSGGLLHDIENIYAGQITCLAFSSDGKFILTGGDSRIYCFYNVSWYEETIARLQGQLCDSNVIGALRNRLTKELSSLEAELKMITG